MLVNRAARVFHRQCSRYDLAGLGTKHRRIMTASDPTTLRVWPYDFSLLEFSRLAKTECAKDIRKLVVTIDQLTTELQDYDLYRKYYLDGFRDNNGTTHGVDLSEGKLIQVGKSAWGKDLLKRALSATTPEMHHIYLESVQSQARYLRLLQSGALHEAIASLRNLESVSIRQWIDSPIYGGVVDAESCWDQHASEKLGVAEWQEVIDQLGSTDSPSFPLCAKTVWETNKHGEILTTVLDALAQRDEAGQGTHVTEMSISSNSDPLIDFVLNDDQGRRGRILHMLRHIKDLSFYERSLGGEPACAGMSDILLACENLETFSASAFGVRDEFDTVYSRTFDNLVRQRPTLWPKLQNLSLEEVRLTPATFERFLETHKASLNALSLVETRATDVHKLLDDVAARTDLQRFYVKCLYGPDSDTSHSIWGRRYLEDGILVTPESNAWLLQDEEARRALKYMTEREICDSIGEWPWAREDVWS